YFLETKVTSGSPLTAPHWADWLFRGLVVYVGLCIVIMLTGVGGQRVTHFVGLLSDSPAITAAAVMAFAAARRAASRSLRRAWACLTFALGLYLIGTLITQVSWFRGFDPFPGPSDVFFVAFYPGMLVGAVLLIRAAEIRAPWIQLSLDATIFVVGFGT